jgi:SulP family sulfate permease
MAVDFAASARSAANRTLRDVFAGSVCSVLAVAYSLSYAALIFSGPLSQWLSYGVAMTFLSAAIGAAVVALRSSIPFAMAGPDSSTSAAMATLVAALTHQIVASGGGNQLESAVIVMALTTALTGVALCVLGLTRAGQAVRFVPYSVIGGFLGATGWLMVLGAIQVMTDHRLTLDDIGTFADSMIAAKLAAGLAIAILLKLTLPRLQSPFVLPAILLVAVATIHLVLPLTSLSVADAQAAGWTFETPAAEPLSLPWKAASLGAFPWASLPSLAGDIVGVIFVTIVSLLLNMTGIEMATRREANIERELRALGAANLTSAAFGGYVSCVSVSRTTLAQVAGATGRIAGITVAVVCAALLVVDPAFLGYVPKYALGGLLLFLGGELVHRWLVQSARQLLLIEYLSLLVIAIIIVKWGFIAGVVIGIAIGCAIFALSASQVNVIKFTFDGSEYRSSLDRDSSELSLLSDHGREIQGMALQSYLFFGSVNRLYEYVKTLLANETGCRFLVFDFRLVTGIDSSAMHSFLQIKKAAAGCGARLVLVHLTPQLEQTFRAVGLISPDTIVASELDRAVEACEEEIIATHRVESGDKKSLHTWLSQVLSSPDHAERLVERCRRLEVQAGDVIARQGHSADAMHFILDGRIGVIVELNDGRSIRVRSVGRNTTIGEMGLIAQRPRSATIQAETASVLYELPADAYEHIKTHEPAVAHALLSYVIEVMAERLNFASRTIGALQR